MICPNCGREVPENKKFCGFCGTALADRKVEPINPEGSLGSQRRANKGDESFSQSETANQKEPRPADVNELAQQRNIQAGEKPQKSRRVLLIVLPILFISAIAIGVILWIRGTNRHLASLVPPEASMQSVEILAYCKDSLGSNVNYIAYIEADQEVILKYGWLASTEEQIQVFIESSDNTVYLDDVLLSGFEMDPVAEFSGPWPEGWPEDKTGYIVQWKKNVGLLKPGNHYVSYTRKINREIFDGIDTFAAGDEWTSGCEIVVD